MQPIRIEISAFTLGRILLITLGWVIFIAAIYLLRTPLTLIAIAFFLAVTLSTPVNFVAEKLKVHRAIATLSIFTLVGIFISTIVYFIIPLVTQQWQQISLLVPHYISETINDPEHFITSRVGGERLQSITEETSALIQSWATRSDVIIDAVDSVIQGVVKLIIVVVLAFFMLVEQKRWLKYFWKIYPSHLKHHHQYLAHRLHNTISGFVFGQIIITTIAATATLIFTSILGLPYVLSLVAVIWLAGLIPLVGNTLGATIVISVGLTQSLTLAIILIVFYLVYQQIENNFIEPLVQAKTVHMTPLLIIISVLVGVHLAGFVGALLAIPVGACIKILIKEIIKIRHNKHSHANM